MVLNGYTNILYIHNVQFKSCKYIILIEAKQNSKGDAPIKIY